MTIDADADADTGKAIHMDEVEPLLDWNHFVEWLKAEAAELGDAEYKYLDFLRCPASQYYDSLDKNIVYYPPSTESVSADMPTHVKIERVFACKPWTWAKALQRAEAASVGNLDGIRGDDLI